MKKNQNEKAEKNEAYMLRQIEESNQIVTLPEEEMDLYARVILYRAQKDLFDLIMEESGADNMEWEPFICVLADSEEERDAVLRVICSGMTERFYSGSFTFSNENVKFLRTGDYIPEDGIIKLRRLFPKEAGIRMIEAFFYKTEYAYYRHLQDTQSTVMAWEDYLEKLMKDEGMFDILVMSFREAITGIDFKYLWNTDGMLEMQPGLMSGIYKILCGKTDTGGDA